MTRTVLLVFGGIFIAGCATTNPISTPPYYPSNPTAVLLTHQGEIQTNASVSTGGETFLAAYALTPHLGLLTDGSFTLHKSGDPNGNQYSGELGAGFFDTSMSGHFEREVYGAAGWGTINDNLVSLYPADIFDNFLETVSNDEQVHFWNAWLQGATGYTGKNFSFMAIIRFSYVNIYHDLNHEAVSGLFETPSHYDTTFINASHLMMFTPGLEARYGFEHIQLIGSIFELLNSESNNPRLLTSLGICYKF